MKINTIAVVGSGLMGGGIAQTCAQAGFNTITIDISQEAIDRASALVKKLLDKKVAKGRMTQDECEQMLGRLSYSTDMEQLAEADVIIEAVPERIDIKKATFEQIDLHARAGALLLSNTSGIDIDVIAEATSQPESVLGMHFFYPAPVMKLVELVPGKKTSEEACAAARYLADRLGKTSVVAPNQPGFIVNRLIVPYQNEGAYLVMEGCNPGDVDEAMRLGCNHPMGPCELMDFTGLDVVLATMSGLHEGLGDDKYRPCPLLKEMVDKGHLGRKSGRGFYTYEN